VCLCVCLCVCVYLLYRSIITRIVIAIHAAHFVLRIHIMENIIIATIRLVKLTLMSYAIALP